MTVLLWRRDILAFVTIGIAITTGGDQIIPGIFAAVLPGFKVLGGTLVVLCLIDGDPELLSKRR
jgi:hypothetical protein